MVVVVLDNDGIMDFGGRSISIDRNGNVGRNRARGDIVADLFGHFLGIIMAILVSKQCLR